MLYTARVSWCPVRPCSQLRVQSKRQRRIGGRQERSPVVATSEHWWEDEEEFDSLTDALKPKRVLLVAAPPSSSSSDPSDLRAYLQPEAVHAAFSAASTQAFATQFWSGRDGPPYFFKVRQRPQLDAAATDAAAAEAAWQELLSQNWRVELDAGLGREEVPTETLLLFCTPAAVQALLHSVVPSTAAEAGGEKAVLAAVEPGRGGTVSLVYVSGTQAGESKSWQELDKLLVMLGKSPSATEPIHL